eukprot:TRINITY_DN12016_c0_g1_i1.p1 TRINITY_DN12016_c0_g1~~TRINITY_DN12016_c0_g1_i1.p1  ORF type:complete len:376 (+),score=54.92 TRINITY_DN12016_c0_g1_i1:221-1348(+)
MQNANLEVIKNASKSFYFSSLLLPHDVRMDIIDLYAFLRYCDDVVDETHSAHPQKRSFLEQLGRYGSHPALQQHTVGTTTPDVGSEFQISSQILSTYDQLAQKHHFSNEILSLFVEGMVWDVSNKLYETEDELVQYCIRVASIVGFYCCAIMGVTEELTLRYACCLGIAMQLTNIARDVGEDMSRGRVYLPLSWLSADLQQHIRTYNSAFVQHIQSGKDESTIDGLSPQDLTPLQRRSIEEAVKKLLALADCYYEAAEKGIAYLPFNCQLAVRTASKVYNEIGVEVTKKDYNSMDSRAHVTLSRKIVLFFHALVVFLLTAVVGLFYVKLVSVFTTRSTHQQEHYRKSTTYTPTTNPRDLSSSSAVLHTVKVILSD